MKSRQCFFNGKMEYPSVRFPHTHDQKGSPSLQIGTTTSNACPIQTSSNLNQNNNDFK